MKAFIQRGGGGGVASTHVMNYTWKEDIPQRLETEKMYGHDWMMMETGPSSPPCARPLQTLELFPITATNLKEEAPHPSNSKFLTFHNSFSVLLSLCALSLVHLKAATLQQWYFLDMLIASLKLVIVIIRNKTHLYKVYKTRVMENGNATESKSLVSKNYKLALYLGGAEDSGSKTLVPDFCLLPIGSMPDEFLSEAPPEALMELKIPGPLIPVLDPSSAAD
ncbi:hypothetical protein CFP56_043069 [Quercus suber]|uniref:Uncharacterized protein n=1 Tax=Quercus suber TaxID=58331 RepID=A0AAW0LJD2_QUESU